MRCINGYAKAKSRAHNSRFSLYFPGEKIGTACNSAEYHSISFHIYTIIKHNLSTEV